MSQLERRLTLELATAIGRCEEYNRQIISRDEQISELAREKIALKDENADLEYRLDQYKKFMDWHFSKEPLGFDDWGREFTEWKEANA